MHVDEPTPDLLTLDTGRNRLFMAFGAVLVAIGLLVLITMAKVTTLTVHRTGPEAGLCRVRETVLWHTHTSALVPLRWLEGAHVEPELSPFGWTFYKLVLHVDDGFGGYPLTWHAFRSEAEAHAGRINSFVKDLEDDAMVVTADNRPLTWPAAALFLGLGALFLLHGAQRLHVSFHRGDRLARIRRKGLFRTQTIAVPFEEIAGFEVAGVSKDCNMYMKRRSGRPVALSLSTDWEAMVGPRRISEIRRRTADQLHAFCAGQEA
jgi:hypothetical protein